jgi:hypothetical protein
MRLPAGGSIEHADAIASVRSRTPEPPRQYWLSVLYDFTRWKDHDAYQKALNRLLRDLRVEGN